MDARGRRIVAEGYDRIAPDYLAWTGAIEGDPREPMLERFAALLPDGARVLDLGCGPGRPSTKRLAEHFRVVGIDISEAQIRLARKNVPEARFVQADLAAVRFAPGSFDGVAALYSILHLPREEHGALFERIAAWLVPGGPFLATLGVDDSPGTIEEWLGVPMFFSGYDAATNRRLLHAAGFELLIDEIVEMQEPGGPVSFLWVLAQAPTG